MRTGGLTTFVGREEEIELLSRRWRQARSRQGGVVLISGEPGVGKSRLVSTFHERIAGERHTLCHYYGSARHSGSPFYPVISAIARLAGLTDDEDPRAQRVKLAGRLAAATASADDVDFIIDLFGLPEDRPSSRASLTPQRRKEETLAALLRHFVHLTRDGPVLILLEDAHWIDPTTLELFDLVVDRVAQLPMLLMVTCRPEFSAPWVGAPQVTSIALSRLDRGTCAALLDGVTGGKALPDRIAEEILDRADGVPLFAEELTKAVLESGLLRDDGAGYALAGGTPPTGIPTTLQASLLARLDKWPAARPVVQAAAALGREFAHGVLAAVCDVSNAELQRALDQLTGAGLISQRGMPPQATYRFKHALVQEAAYGTLLRVPRQQLHVRIVETLEAQFPTTVAAEPELLALYCERARLMVKAIDYWRSAAQRSFARASLEEAQAQLTKGFELLPELAEVDERLNKEIDLCLALAHVLRAGRGTAAPQTGEAYERARLLCEQSTDERRLVSAVYGTCLFHFNRAELELASSRAEVLTRPIQDRATRAVARVAHQEILGLVDFERGRLLTARSHLQAAMPVVEATDQWLMFGEGPDPNTLVYLAWTQCLLGHLDVARAQAERALALVHRNAAPAQRLCAVLANFCYLEQFCDRTDAVKTLAEKALPLASEKGFSPFRGIALFFQGWALGRRGQTEAGLELMRAGLAAYRGNSQFAEVPYFEALLAELLAATGRHGDALELLDGAFERMERTGERWFAAEAHRRKGHLLSRTPAGIDGAAEREFLRAIDVAREQEAKLWQLHAATDLANLWRGQGRRESARDLLAPIYATFNQGFDTPSVQRAKGLLDELGR